MPPLDELTQSTLDEAASAAAGFARTLPPRLASEGRALVDTLGRIRTTTAQAADAVDEIDDPAPDATPMNDPVAVRRDLLAEAESRVTEGTAEMDSWIERVSGELRRGALPPAPTGVDAQLARDEIRQVLGSTEGAEAMRRAERLARTADRAVAGALLSPWGRALLEERGAGLADVEGPILASAAAGVWGEGRKAWAAPLARWGSLLESRSKAGAAKAALARIGKRGPG